MAIPPEVIAESEKRLPANVAGLRDKARTARVTEMNSAKRIIDFVAGPAAERAALDGDGALERILGTNDLMNINFLEKGTVASRSVGRISICNAAGNVIGFGTGFLVSPRLLLTNNHVFGDAATAANSFVEFNYQLDLSGRPASTVTFSFEPTAAFVTSKKLDYTIVAVRETSDNGKSTLSEFGHLTLSGTPGKTLDANYLTIIQHPSGQLKQIALRENQLIKTLEEFLWYATDTAPGSSGACVFNDSWQVVALHHSGVPATDANGNWLAVDGSVWTPAMGDQKVKWLANEGVRTSSIVGDLMKVANNPLIAALLKTAGAISAPTPGPEITVVRASDDASAAAIDAMGMAATQEKISIDPNYDDRHGYDPAFLGTGVRRVALPKLSNALLKKAALKLEDDGHLPHVLTYHHYSVVMNAERRLAFFTAVNIDGTKAFRLKRETDKWFYDPRIDRGHQIGNELYKANKLDRGHLVRRLDPAWGDSKTIAKVANDDTFHWTNCSPQHEEFNQGNELWAGLEDYVLDKADDENFKVTVFTGPILRTSDRTHPGTEVQVPDDFWKVVVAVTPERKLSATGYVVSQKKLITPDIAEAAVGPFGAYRTFQVPISRVAQETGLDFGKLVNYDPLAAEVTNTESSFVTGQLLEDFEQIRL
jgi:endonuclease G